MTKARGDARARRAVGWFRDDWIDAVLAQIPSAFDRACDRWRGLYRTDLSQARSQDRIIRDASRSPEDKKQAERLRREAEEQLKLLTEIDNLAQSDFYSYRSFASEGVLPGYNFLRLPLSAFIPARRTRQRDEFLSRPRFPAIAEFGPRAIVYHEGARCTINKVILPPAAVERPDAVDPRKIERAAEVARQVGFFHWELEFPQVFGGVGSGEMGSWKRGDGRRALRWR